jgi:hypothetical protein
MIPKIVKVFQYKEIPIGKLNEKKPIMSGKINRDCV